jgi:hypothetical protein
MDGAADKYVAAAAKYERAAILPAEKAGRIEKANDTLKMPLTLEEFGVHPSLCAKVRTSNPGMSDEALIAKIRAALAGAGRPQ